MHVLFWLKINCENQEIDCNQYPMLREILKRQLNFFLVLFGFSIELLNQMFIEISIKKT
jgi:hypothetical protein